MKPKRSDYFFISVVATVSLSFILYIVFDFIDYKFILIEFFEAQYNVINEVWFGVLISIFFVGLLHKLPDEAVSRLFGRGDSFNGMLRAAFAGLFLDLCSHGILLIAMKLYKKGINLGQIICFLIASPWNSLSMTIILATLIGVSWTLAFIFLSLILAVISGLIFNKLVTRNKLPRNPNIPTTTFLSYRQVTKDIFNKDNLTFGFAKEIIVQGVKNSKIVIKWLCVGIILSGVLNSVMSDEHIGRFFAPTLMGLGITLGLATILEVCSEGLAPVAGDIFNKGKAVGNTFAFLMSGVATDYTEIMVIKDTTKSWKIAFFLPLVLVPQVVFIAMILNQF